MEEEIEAKLEVKEEVKERSEKKLFIPGEAIASGPTYLPGDNTMRDGKDIIALKFGFSQIEDRLVKIIPLSGPYIPRRGNIIIGKIIDMYSNGWILDINSPYDAFLSVVECKGFIPKKDIETHYNLGDFLICQIFSVKSTSADLTMKDRGLHRVEEGIILEINSNKVPRVIGKQGSMIQLIKDSTGCDIAVGQNGIIWIKGGSIGKELIAKEAILKITEKSIKEGLTEEIEKFLKSTQK